MYFHFLIIERSKRSRKDGGGGGNEQEVKGSVALLLSQLVNDDVFCARGRMHTDDEQQVRFSLTDWARKVHTFLPLYCPALF